MSALGLLALVLELRVLKPLASWEPFGGRLLLLQGAATGSEGLSPGEVTRLRSWAARWPRLRPSLRSFYATHHDDGAVSAALWLVLEGRGVTDPNHRRSLHIAWRRANPETTDPPFDLAPRLD